MNGAPSRVTPRGRYQQPVPPVPLPTTWTWQSIFTRASLHRIRRQLAATLQIGLARPQHRNLFRTLAAPEFSSIFAGNFAGKCAATGYIAGRRPNSRRPKFFPTYQRNIFLLRCPILILIITLT
jgi:hypothetical protein